MQDYKATARFEAHVSKQRMWIIAFLALGFAVLGLWFVSAAEALSQSVRFVFFRDPLVLRVFGCVAILFGVAGAITAVRQLFRTGPVIDIGPDGVRWRRWSDQTIPWRAITDATSRSMSGQQFLCLKLVRPDDYPGKSTARLLAGMNKNMGFGDIAISTDGTDRSHAEMLEAASHFGGRPIASN